MPGKMAKPASKSIYARYMERAPYIIYFRESLRAARLSLQLKTARHDALRAKIVVRAIRIKGAASTERKTIRRKLDQNWFWRK